MHHAEPHEDPRDAEPDAAHGFCVWPNNQTLHDASHIMWPRTLPFPNEFPRLRGVLLGVSEAVVHEHTEPLDRIVEGDDSGEVRQTRRVSSLDSFHGQIRVRCGRHVVCPRSTPFPSRVWCGSHIMWPRTRPFPVFAPLEA